MKKVVALILIFFPLTLSAQCDSMPVVYNLLKPESRYVSDNFVKWVLPTVAYIGYPKDSIYIGIGSNIDKELEKHVVTGELSKKGLVLHYEDRKLKISTCGTIIKMLFKWSKEKREILNCYAVVVKNVDVLPVEIAIRKDAILRVETLDSTGHWKTINDRAGYDCVTGDKRYFIKPNEVVVLPFPISEDISQKTIRFRMGDNYSNIIRKQEVTLRASH